MDLRDDAANLRLKTLGQLALDGDSHPELSRRRKLLALLAVLASRVPRGISRDELSLLFWEDVPERRARQSLRQALLRLRRALGDDAFEQDDETIRLRADVVVVDAEQFERDVQDGRDTQALACWDGDYLTGCEDVGGESFRAWLEAERERYRVLLGRAAARAVDAALDRGDWDAAVSYAEQWARALPWDEGAHLRQIESLRLARRWDEAAVVHATFTNRLRDLGIEPSPALHEAATVLQHASANRARVTGSRALFTPDFVGRTDVFQELAAVWQRVAEGHGAAAIVTGEEGIGRTRLCEELLRWTAARTGAPFVLAGRAYAAERDTRWSLLRDVLHSLHSAPGLGGAPDAALAAVAALVPAIRDRYPALPAPPDPEAPQLLDALSRVLTDVAAETPVLVIADDAGFADPASHAVLLGLARRPPPGVLVLLAGDSRTAGAEHADLLATATTLELGPLDADAVEAMLASMMDLDPAVRRALARRLHHEAGGNPFGVIALLNALADVGVLITDADGGWTLTADPDTAALPLPADMREAVRARVDRLPAQVATVLEAAAVLNGPADSALLRRCSGVDETAFAAALDTLLGARLLREVSLAEGRTAFDTAHDLLRRCVYETTNPVRRETLHRAALDALERSPGAGSERSLAARTYHRARAGEPRRPSRRRFTLIVASLSVIAGLTAVFWPRPPSAPSSTVAVFPFAVRGSTEADYLRDGLVDLLAVSIDGAGGLRAVDVHAVLAASRGSAQLSPREARSLATRLGAGSFVLGSVVRAADRIQLSASLYDARGRTIGAAQSRPGPEADLFDLVDDLSRALLAILHPEPDRHFTRLAAATTPSLPALKAFLDGERAHRLGRYAEAADAYRDALAADSLFALAHYRLALAIEWAGAAEPNVYRSLIQRALQYADRLPALDRDLLRGFAAYHAGRSAEAETILRSVVAEQPENVDAWFALGEVLMHGAARSGRPDALVQAGDAFERARTLDPTHEEATLHLVRIAAWQGAHDRLRPLLQELSSSGLAGSPILLATEAFITFTVGTDAERQSIRERLLAAPALLTLVAADFVAVYGRDIDGAAELASLLASPPRPAPIRAAGHVFRAQLAAAAGRMSDAWSELDYAESLDPRLAAHYRALLIALPNFETADPVRVVEALGALARVQTLPERTPTPADVPFATLHPGLEHVIGRYAEGLLHAARGDVEAAMGTATRLESLQVREIDNRELAASLARGLRADIAARQGLVDDALALLDGVQYETWHQAAMSSPFAALARERFLRAQLLERAGRADEAVRWYETIETATPSDLVYRSAARTARERLDAGR